MYLRIIYPNESTIHVLILRSYRGLLGLALALAFWPLRLATLTLTPPGSGGALAGWGREDAQATETLFLPPRTPFGLEAFLAPGPPGGLRALARRFRGLLDSSGLDLLRFMAVVSAVASLAVVGLPGSFLDRLLDTVLDCVLDQELEEPVFLFDVLPFAIWIDMRKLCRVSRV
jgi:hypothetical protein